VPLAYIKPGQPDSTSLYERTEHENSELKTVEVKFLQCVLELSFKTRCGVC